MKSDFYPHIEANDMVLFATNPNAQDGQFRPGVVRIAKLNSCDITVDSDHGREYRHDCLHIDDPRCKEPAIWNETGRGVFKLAPRELQRRNEHEERMQDRDAVQQVKATMRVVMGRIEELETRIETIVLGAPPARRGRPPKQIAG